KNSAYDDLPDEKKRLVDAYCAGLDAQLPEASPAVIAHCRTNGEKGMQQLLGSLPPDGDQMFDLSLKSDEDLQAGVAMALGLVAPKDVKDQKAAAALIVGPGKKATPAHVRKEQTKWLDTLNAAQKAVVVGTAAGMRMAIDASCPNKFIPAADPTKQV